LYSSWAFFPPYLLVATTARRTTCGEPSPPFPLLYFFPFPLSKPGCRCTTWDSRFAASPSFSFLPPPPFLQREATLFGGRAGSGSSGPPPPLLPFPFGLFFPFPFCPDICIHVKRQSAPRGLFSFPVVLPPAGVLAE